MILLLKFGFEFKCISRKVNQKIMHSLLPNEAKKKEKFTPPHSIH